MTNPYESPHEMGFVPVSDLAKASQCLSVMGSFAVAYACVIGIGVAGSCATNHKLHIALRLLSLLVPLILIPLTALLARPAFLLAKDPSKYMRQARWLAIILGTFFFPLLTWPAYYAVQQMNRYAASQRH